LTSIACCLCEHCSHLQGIEWKQANAGKALQRHPQGETSFLQESSGVWFCKSSTGAFAGTSPVKRTSPSKYLENRPYVLHPFSCSGKKPALVIPAMDMGFDPRTLPGKWEPVFGKASVAKQME